jgi:hypothetical protein
MHKQLLAVVSALSILASGCALEPGREEELAVDAEQALVTDVVFKGGGNTGFSGQASRNATITADSLAHANANGGIGINLKVSNAARPPAGSVTSAACAQRTITVTYNQADTGPFTVSSPNATVHNGRCIATVLLQWNRARPAGTKTVLPPSSASSSQRVQLSAMPVQPAKGTISVVTKTNGVTNTDPFDFRVDP